MHPGVDFSQESLVLKNAYFEQITKIRDAISHPANEVQKLAEEYRKASKSAQAFKNALAEVEKSMPSTNALQKLAEEYRKASEPSKEFKNALLKLGRSSYRNKLHEALAEAKQMRKLSKAHGK